MTNLPHMGSIIEQTHKLILEDPDRIPDECKGG